MKKILTLSLLLAGLNCFAQKVTPGLHLKLGSTYYLNSNAGMTIIDYKSYFDDNGRLVAFVREANFFNSECTGNGDGVVHESLTKYYAPNLTLTDSVYTLRNGKNQPIRKSDCITDYNYPYRIIKLLDTYLRVNHIRA